MITKSRIAFAFIALYASIAILCWRYCRVESREKSEVSTHIFSAEIVARSMKLARAFHGNRDDLQVCAQMETSQTFAGAIRNHWIIEFRDNCGVYLGNMNWDADSGELISVNNDLIRSSSNGWKLSRPLAVRVAHNWLLRMRLNQRVGHWALYECPELLTDTWSVRFSNGRRTASVTIDAASGHLFHLSFCPLPGFSKHWDPASVR
jgi:hypothetical protein